MIKHRDGCKRRPCNCGFEAQQKRSSERDRKEKEPLKKLSNPFKTSKYK